MRIGIAGINHETHTFLPQKTPLEQFVAQRGLDVISTHRGCNNSMGGFIDVCEEMGVELVPIVYASGGVSGLVVDEVYTQFAGEMCEGFGKVAKDLDGILLALHGAMVTESIQAPETRIVQDLRQVVGQEMPIMVALDLHGNLNRQLDEASTALFGYHCSPHTDAGQTGRRAARAMIDFLQGKTRPRTAFAKPGLVIPSVFSATTLSPAKDIIDRIRYWEKQPGVIDVSFFFGFAWSDVEQLGASAVAVTDNSQELAERIVKDLSDYAWSLRRELTTGDNIYSVRDGVALAIEKSRTARKPIVILDHSDRLNDTTFVLRELLEQGAVGAAHPLLYDPQAAQECLNAGQGNTVDIMVGSKSSDVAGGPVRIVGKVLWEGEKSYFGTGPMTIGRKISHGLTALVQVNDLWLQIVSKMESLIDTDPIIQFGYQAEDFRIIVTKSKTHFRAVYEEVGEEIIIVDAPAYSPVDLSAFTYRNVPAGVYPLTKKDEK